MLHSMNYVVYMWFHFDTFVNYGGGLGFLGEFEGLGLLQFVYMPRINSLSINLRYGGLE